MDVVGANGAEVRGSSCGFLETYYEVEGKKYEGRFVAEVGGKQRNLGSENTTASYLLGQEEGDSYVMGGLTSYL